MCISVDDDDDYNGDNDDNDRDTVVSRGSSFGNLSLPMPDEEHAGKKHQQGEDSDHRTPPSEVRNQPAIV